MEKNNVAIVCGGYWCKYMPVSIYSLCFNNPEKLKIYLIHTDCNESAIKEITNYFECEIIFLNADDVYNSYNFTGMNVDNRFSKYTNIRLVLPNIIKDDFVLYIDADAIVNKSLDSIFNININRYYFAGCKDTGLYYGHKTQLGMHEDANYFNAGVCFFNLKKIREDNIMGKWLYLINNIWYLWHDQDVINKTLSEKSLELEPIANSCVSTKIIKDPIIAHYAGLKEPWVYNLPLHEIWEFWEGEYNKWLLSK